MTANQIKAAELFERKRSNLVNESLGRDTLTETGRHNRAVEGETLRHNTQTEAIDYGRLGVDRARIGIESSKLTETQRHNQALESIDSARVLESVRHNQAGESIDTRKVGETRRHNVHSEVQGYIHNASELAGTAAKIITMVLGS